MDRNPAPELLSSVIDDAFAFERATATPLVSPAMRARRAAPTAQVMAALPLDELQEWFQRVITHPECVDAAVAEAGVSPDQIVTCGAQIDSMAGLEIYHYAYRARLVDCLRDDYPALSFAMGDEAFHALAERYIAQFPSRSPNLNSFGQRMEAFCRERTDLHFAFYADIARLEWALVETLHAEDVPPLGLARLTEIAPALWSSARFVPSETLRVAGFAYPVNAYYQSWRRGEAPTIPEPAPTALAIYRQGFTLWRMLLTPTMNSLLIALSLGAPLGEALADVEAGTDAGADVLSALSQTVMRWFASWVEGGFFKAIELAEAAS